MSHDFVKNEIITEIKQIIYSDVENNLIQEIKYKLFDLLLFSKKNQLFTDLELNYWNFKFENEKFEYLIYDSMFYNISGFNEKLWGEKIINDNKDIVVLKTNLFYYERLQKKIKYALTYNIFLDNSYIEKVIDIFNKHLKSDNIILDFLIKKNNCNRNDFMSKILEEKENNNKIKI